MPLHVLASWIAGYQLLHLVAETQWYQPGHQECTSEIADAQTTLTRCDSRGEAWWTLQQAPNSCSLVWFNASWPLVSRYEVIGAHGTESCDPSDSSVFWLGMFQFEVCMHMALKCYLPNPILQSKPHKHCRTPVQWIRCLIASVEENLI